MLIKGPGHRANMALKLSPTVACVAGRAYPGGMSS